MNLRNQKIIIIIAMLSFLLVGNSSVLADAANDTWLSGNISREGYGAPPTTSSSNGQARILARRAAIVDAYRNLSEYIAGVRIDSETTVQDMTVRDDIIKTRVSAIIKGAKILSERSNNDGSYSVVVGISMYGSNNSLASAVLPSWDKVEPFPLKEIPPAVSAPSYQSTSVIGNFTGLIVDCRDLGLQSVMSPTIKNSNNEPIYGYKNLDYDKVIKKGMAGYSKDGYNNLGRAGSNPLVVKAIRLDGHNSNPVLSMEDAQRVLRENQASGFLNDCAVVFIK